MNPVLKFHLSALTRFIYYVTEEEDRLITDLSGMAPALTERMFVFNLSLGLTPIKELVSDWRERKHTESKPQEVHAALIKIYKDDPGTSNNYYIITDPEELLSSPVVVRRFMNIAHQLYANDSIVKVIIFVGSRLVLPHKLQRYVEVIRDTGLSQAEIKTALTETCTKINQPITPSLVQSFQGLTRYETRSAIYQSIVATRKSKPRLDPNLIRDYKKKQLQKTSLINYVDVTKDSFDNVGGISRFKSWVKKTKAAWSEEGQAFGLVPPKGLLLVGAWGCGKSISVKALGTAWDLPVIQLELGKLRNSGVGESESNVYRVISLIESVENCIVWIDEAEKSLSGGQSSSQSDAGTTGRMIGILSTWLQETNARICLAMTANSLKNLPVEFVRRCNERFFFDLPTEEERIDILKIHLKKRNQDPSLFNLADLAGDAKLMVGSEIEQAILAGMVESFDAKKTALDEAILSSELRKKPRIAKTLGDDLKEVLDWVGYDPDTDEGIRARFASDRRGEGFGIKSEL